MKKFKNNKSLIIGLASVLGIASLATAVGVTTSQKANVSTGDSVDKPGPFQVTTHHTVTFNLPRTPIPNFYYEGRTTVDVKDNYPFGIIAAPNAVASGYQFSYWEYDPEGDGTYVKIEKSTKITSDLNIYPVMTPIAPLINITSEEEEPHNLYSGLLQPKLYTVETSQPITADDVEWDLVDAEGETVTDAVISEDPALPSCTVTPLTILEPKVCYLKATVQGITEPVLYKLTIYPPYYYTGTQEIGGVEYDYGTCYWVYNTGSPIEWEAIPAADVCPTVFVPGAQINIIRHMTPEGSISPISRTSLNNFSHIFPGCKLNSVGDNFLRQTNFNGQLHGGVNAVTKQPKVLASVGDYFLADCTSFNQNINDVFTIGSDYSFRIGDYFMASCTAFNNGGIDFVLPTADFYGNSFMEDCSALTGEITLASQTLKIGDHFMNGTSISAATIPSTFGGPEAEPDVIGAYFLTDCEQLVNLNILTDDVSYFKELNVPGQDHASFVRYSEYDDETGITLLCPNASEQFLDGFTELDGTDGYYRHFTLDTDTYIRSWDYAGPGGQAIHFANPYDPMTATAFTNVAAATTAYSNAIEANPDILLSDFLDQEDSMHNASTIDTWTLTLTNLDVTEPTSPRATYRVQINQSRSMAGMINMTQVCNLEFTNIPFAIYDNDGSLAVASPYVIDSSVMSDDWATVLARLQGDTTWSIKGSATLIYEPIQAGLEEYEINKVWTNLNINSANASSSDFLSLDHPLIANPYGAFACMGIDSHYLSLCSLGE